MNTTVKKDENLNKINDWKTNAVIFEEGMKYLMNTYTRQPVVFEKAKMQYLWDVEGNKYTDFTSGYGCLNVGHSNKEVVAAVKKQVSKIIQPSNIYFSESQVMPVSYTHLRAHE